MVKRIILLCDAGKDIGFGHYSRCKSLTDCFLSNGLKSKLFCNWVGTSKPESVESFDWQDHQKLEGMASGFNVALIDSYNVSHDQFKFFSECFDTLIVLDDFGRLDDYRADLVINPNVYGHKVQYKNHSIGGADYVILREEFREKNASLEVRDELNRILVTVGGSDYRELIPKLIQIFSDLNYTFEMVCASDEYAKYLSKRLGGNNIILHGFVSAKQMHELMLGCDLAITACGQTLHELARVGCPSIGIVIDEDQRLNAESYQDIGLLDCPIQWDDDNLQKKLLKRIEKMESQNIRLKYSSIGPKVVDGMGVERILQEIIAL